MVEGRQAAETENLGTVYRRGAPAGTYNLAVYLRGRQARTRVPSNAGARQAGSGRERESRWQPHPR